MLVTAPLPTLRNLLRQLHEPADHGALRIGQRIDDGEMVHAGDRLVAGLRAALAPGLGNAAALAQELARLQTADHGIEHAAFRRRPGERRGLARALYVELELLVHGYVDESGEGEH